MGNAKEGVHRQITNVASGVDSHDAVNVRQLTAVIDLAQYSENAARSAFALAAEAQSAANEAAGADHGHRCSRSR